ncbi:gamma-type small acid-soluble spore protein [Metabacillus iocasae]|uniref:Small, acid-soluble spore protein gamma-type n=1 Tax=Priestia iocasae TaxID=2291674 RepID=A0ABS2QYD7_9BACI|nr:gamma-type small acid-soluble spore protein [Metabacillus iocasae]MBM7704432.1 small acid-soluble spore protein E (minor gamma-type SASP) [Metabacillus iocasae]
MANKNQPNQQKTASGTSIQHVKQQNAQANQQYGAEFASETSAQHVKQQNAQAQAKQNQASSKNQ